MWYRGRFFNVLGILALFISPVFGQETLVEVVVNRTLTITVPPAISYTLSNPLALGEEVITTSHQVVLEGNDFDNTTSPLVAYITVSMTGSVTNAQIKITNISVSTLDTVTANPTTADITLTDAPLNYAFPDISQNSTYGTITGSHTIKINKTGAIPAGSYSLIFNWTGNDGGP